MDSGAPKFIGGFDERIVATVDELALYARDYPPLLPETGLPVICLHGLTRNSRDFDDLARRVHRLAGGDAGHDERAVLQLLGLLEGAVPGIALATEKSNPVFSPYKYSNPAPKIAAVACTTDSEEISV